MLAGILSIYFQKEMPRNLFRQKLCLATEYGIILSTGAIVHLYVKRNMAYLRFGQFRNSISSPHQLRIISKRSETFTSEMQPDTSTHQHS